MLNLTKRIGQLALTGLAAAGLAVSTAQAQYMNRPIFGGQQAYYNQQAALNLAIQGQAYSYSGGFPRVGGYPPGYVNPLAANAIYSSQAYAPYGAASMSSTGYAPTVATSYDNGQSSYSSPYQSYGEPLSGYLRGSADVINAQSRFQISKQQAAIIQQQVEQSKIETRRKLFEEWKYYRDNTPTWQDDRERTLASELRRSQTNPPMPEVWSGKALNDLLEHAAKMQLRNGGPQVSQALDDDTLKHVNVVAAGKNGNIGILKNEGQLNWPQVLKDSAFDMERKQIDQLTPDAVRQAQFGKVDSATLEDLSAASKRLSNLVSAKVFDLAPSKFIEASRYMKQLDDAIKTLGQPEVTNYFTSKFSAQGKNVAELVKFMAGKGLRFAPAVAGDESYYSALHHALASYDLSLQNAVVSEK